MELDELEYHSFWTYLIFVFWYIFKGNLFLKFPVVHLFFDFEVSILNNSFTRSWGIGFTWIYLILSLEGGWVHSALQDLSLRRKKPQDEVLGTLEREFLPVSHLKIPELAGTGQDFFLGCLTTYHIVFQLGFAMCQKLMLINLNNGCLSKVWDF